MVLRNVPSMPLDTSTVVRRSWRLALYGLLLDTLLHLATAPPAPWLMERLGVAGLDHERLFFGYDGLFFAAGMIVIFPLHLITANEYPIAWLMGAGGSRSGLARAIVGRVVLAGALPLLVFYVAVEWTQSQLGSFDPRFDLLLKVQILGLLAFVIAFAFRRKYPNRFLTHVHLYLAMTFWFAGHQLSDSFELGMPVLVLLVIGSALATVFAVGHGLARADYLL